MFITLVFLFALHTPAWHSGYDNGVIFAGIDRMVGVSIQPKHDCTNIDHVHTGQAWQGCVTGERAVIKANGNLLTS